LEWCHRAIRGGYTVDLVWRDGRLASKKITGGDSSGYVIR